MSVHYHFSIENLLYVGVSAWLFLNLLKIITSWLVANPATAALGKALAGTIAF